MFKRALSATTMLALVVLAAATPAAGAPSYTYQSHVQDVGWQMTAADGAISGTTGQGKRLEALRFDFAGQQARGHVEDLGWQEWHNGAGTVGTTGQGKRLEAVQVKSATEGVIINCQAHVQGDGWLPVVGDGEVCGTVGMGKQLEAVRLWTADYASPDDGRALSTVATAGDFNAGPQSAEVLREMGASNPDLAFILGDISQSATTTSATCGLIRQYLSDDPFGWVQGNHDVPPDSDGPVTADWNKCLPVTPNATGTRGVEEVIRIPGARIISASPHLPGSNYDTGSPESAQRSMRPKQPAISRFWQYTAPITQWACMAHLAPSRKRSPNWPSTRV
jgi:hypothetical protein